MSNFLSIKKTPDFIRGKFVLSAFAGIIATNNKLLTNRTAYTFTDSAATTNYKTDPLNHLLRLGEVHL